MRKSKEKNNKKLESSSKRLSNSVLKLKVSQYSRRYQKYMESEYAASQLMIKRIIQLPCCREYYLRFPLEGLLKGVVKKMMMNCYEVLVFGLFLEKIQEWRVGADIFLNLSQFFPDIIHVNQPTNPDKLKYISMFLYFSSYSVKEFLSNDMQLYEKQMNKILPQFQKLHTHWVNNQSTVNFSLHPRTLNSFFKKINNYNLLLDYNTCVDKILQISPCYDLSNREEKKRVVDFGYMENMQENSGNNYLGYERERNDGSGELYDYGQSEKIEELPGIDLMDLQYDGADL